ncbi:GntR family transcriptional regulator [Pelagibacterium lentulum]|uniref:Transcriptional regulator n=1 Tax=Pelagibacterium lentulum TaxID=2029865 RepID=A0A916RE37_9HYPH|nr:GntR family transcriptional regulator [Pelagibacterium lentulum]GGA50132.1 transcriptional regulator [Pelagibacterium lentulum]
MDNEPENDTLTDETRGPAGRRKGQLHTEAASRLRAMILSGELPPGARLREMQLCDQLGVSRTPVREAFRTLAAEGLVDLLPNRSVLVSELHAPDLEHLFLVFGSVEGLAAELACQRISEAEIGEIGRLLADMIDFHGRQERASYMSINQLIHRRTVEIAANPVLLSVWQSLVPRVERARALANLDTGRWTEALFEHTKMFTALASRDGELLARLTRQHFLNSLPYLQTRSDSKP